MKRLASRLLLMLLVLWLPVQFAWAAVGSYCAHEAAGSSAAHFGHHDHQHNGVEEAAEPADKNDAHADCAACHFGVAAPHAIMTSSSTAQPFVVSDGMAGAPTSAPATRPERPNWRPA
ncbi:MAG: hypothetical protein ACKVQQ_16775 [Burkholderiales bacterium]